MKHMIVSVWWLLPLCLGALASVVLSLSLFLSHRRNTRIRRTVSLLEHRSEDQVRFIRSMLDLCYSYRESPQVFLDKFKDNVNIRHLKSYDLIDLPSSCLSGLKEDERILYCLFQAGFTQRELCVIFNLKKTSNLYVKLNRIKKKIPAEGACQ